MTWEEIRTQYAGQWVLIRYHIVPLCCVPPTQDVVDKDQAIWPVGAWVPV
jgi:hypothetical protein